MSRTTTEETAPDEVSRRRSRLFVLILLTAAILYGVVAAIQRRWVCDDAFISYRYALNLVEGHGLVYNPGERVEGYSNFLWTLWCAVSLMLGIRCEDWTIFWGVVCYAASLALLGLHFRQVQRKLSAGMWAVPLAAILGALHVDWAIFATSGLETSLFTLLAVAGYVLIVSPVVGGGQQPIAAGLVMTLAALTRPDGVIFAAVGGALMLWFAWPRWKPAILYGLAFALPHAAFIAWRVWYYGDFFPNTYYAKSGNLAWWEQGRHYLGLYLQRYGVLLLSAPALGVCCWRRRMRPGTEQTALRRLGIAAAAMGAVYAVFIVRVGGDFMFARMFVPATPFFLMVIELGLLALPIQSVFGRVIIAGAIAAGLVLPPAPMTGTELAYGVANEWDYYRDRLVRDEKDLRALVLKKYLSDLPVAVAYFGSEAHTMYRARIRTAIESEAGLTDATIAHQTLTERGRIGHEKNGTAEYVISKRKAHFTFHPEAAQILQLERVILGCRIDLDGLLGWVLHWDPVIMEELGKRGAKFADLPAQIDQWTTELTKMDDATVRELYAKLRFMYFDHVSDPSREAAFRKRLGLQQQAT